jgi:PKD domain
MLQRLTGRLLASLTVTFALVACGGGGGSGSSGPTPVASETPAAPLVAVNPPVARISASGLNADSDGLMRGGVNGLIGLDASASTDPSGTVQSYAWVLSQVPSGSKANLSNANQKAATFTPDVAGKYQVTLTVTGSGGQSVSKAVEVMILQAPPIASIVVSAFYSGLTTPTQMAPMDAVIGSTFTLDSSRAKASDGTAVSTAWTLEQQPAGSLAKLQGSESRFQFVPDLMGIYVLRARVRDTYGNFSDALYTLRVLFAPPSAATMIVSPSFSGTASEQTPIDTTLGTHFVLDSSDLRASDGGPIRTSWILAERPAGSLAFPVGNAPRVQFRPDQMGLYKLVARVEDARGAYVDSTLLVNVRYMAPTTAGMILNTSFVGTTIEQAPISASLGSVFAFDGTAIRAEDGGPVTASWQVVERPAGSQAAVIGSGLLYQYTPDVLGYYKLKVRIQDQRGGWGESVYTLSVLNRPPQANANYNTTPVASVSYSGARVQRGATLALRGGASFDADGDALMYSWTLTSKPPTSATVLSATTTVDTSLTFDVAGNYIAILRVTDPSGAYSDRQVAINAGDAPPVVVYDHNSWTMIFGSVATANVGFSYSPQGSPLTYQWTLDSKPAGSAAMIPVTNTGQLSLLPDLPGTYTASVVVSDGTLKSGASFTLRVLANATRTTELAFKPLVTRYSKGLDQLVMTSTGPNLLSFMDPFTGLLRSVPLPAVPKGLSISPDGKLALVLYESVVDLFDVATATRIRTSTVLSVRSEALVLNSGEAILYGGDQWSGVPGLVNARTGEISAVNLVYGAGTFWGSQQFGLYADRLNTAFTVSGGLSPSKVTSLKLDFTAATKAVGSVDWPYHGTYNANVPIALNASQTLLFDAAGLAVRTSDLTFVGRIDLTGNIRSVSSSNDDSELLALKGPFYSWYGFGTFSSSYASIDPATLFVKSTLSLPTLSGQQSYGLGVFHSAADRHVLIVQTGGDNQLDSGKRFWVVAR